ncbi:MULTISPECIES: hypothetical protein [unclassified Mycobacterium]|uniref:hypothetical protein n=1 Tax=unclassified Mycobacterium TaxID=2642494 RepID=UPI0008021274|nr:MULTISPECIES: hypothetical protein [unclassified Mycobacterium]OBB48171.1 hypothetical protein A5752_22425 [Mycobacterium sp. 852002-51961_SCH5331710]OBH00035.1 hypothetical protein A5698_09575 [Mycobacterium sp. E136]
MSVVGDWDVSIKTPVGTLHVVYSFTNQAGGISGTAASNAESVPLVDIAVVEDLEGQRVTWRQTVTKPMRLKLDFDVHVRGDRMSGHSRAGRLPRSTVSGVRRV